MGSCCASETVEERNIRYQGYKDKLGEKFVLAQDNNRVHTVLLLGRSGAGKSTFFLDMRRHCTPWTVIKPEEREECKGLIRWQSITSMELALEQVDRLKKEYSDLLLDVDATKKYSSKHKVTIDGMKISLHDLTFSDDHNVQQAVSLIKNTTHSVVNQETANAIDILRKQKPIEIVCTLSRIQSTAPELWENIQMIAADDYESHAYHMMMLEKPTTYADLVYEFIWESRFDSNPDKYEIFQMFDCSRSYWSAHWNYFGGYISGAVYFVDLSCYDEIDKESGKNAMVDSLEYFEEIVNDERFKKSSMVIIFNKYDLFEQKVKRVPITVCPRFGKFRGGSHCRYIQDQFEELIKNRSQIRRCSILGSLLLGTQYSRTAYEMFGFMKRNIWRTTQTMENVGYFKELETAAVGYY